MELIFECPHCHGQYQVPSNLADTEAECPDCGEPITIPKLRLGPGVIIGGFRLEKHLGKGSMGDVYLATQLSMGRKVAIKMLPQQMTIVEESVNRFLHEVQTSAKMEHPNIVTAFDAGQDNGTYYLAMSYVEGEDFDEVVRREGPVPERRALESIRDVTKGLKYAWDEHRLLHRDIKPGNMMVDRHGTIKLMDLGISKSMHDDASLTMPGLVVGTPHYMSPEQAWSEGPIDFRSDLYGVGATLYMLLTGRPPYLGTSQGVFTMLIKPEPYPAPQTINPKISNAAAALVETMMAPKPEQRQQSWDELLDELDRVIRCEMPLRQMPSRAADPNAGLALATGSTGPQNTGTKSGLATVTLGPIKKKGPGTSTVPRQDGEGSLSAPAPSSEPHSPLDPAVEPKLGEGSGMAMIQPKQRNEDSPKLSLTKPKTSKSVGEESQYNLPKGPPSVNDMPVSDFDPEKSSVLRLRKESSSESTPQQKGRVEMPPIDMTATDKKKKPTASANVLTPKNIGIAAAIVVVGLIFLGVLFVVLNGKPTETKVIKSEKNEKWDDAETVLVENPKAAKSPVPESLVPDPQAPATVNRRATAAEIAAINADVKKRLAEQLDSVKIDDAQIAALAGLPWPIKEPSASIEDVNKIIESNIQSYVTKKYPDKDFAEEADAKYGPLKVGDAVTVVYKEQGDFATYKGVLREIATTRIRVNDKVLPMMDLEASFRDRLDVAAAERKARDYAARQKAEYAEKQEDYAGKAREAITSRAFEHFGYVKQGDAWVSAKVVFDAAVAAGKRQAAAQLEAQLNSAVYKEHGFISNNGEWYTTKP